MKTEICLFIFAFFQVSQSLKFTPDKVIVGEGGSCGGFTQIPRICDTGLTCLTPTQDPNGPIIADLPGKCRKTANIVGEGKWCEAKARPENIKYCKNGLICVFPDIVKEIPGLPGVCQRPSITSRVSTTVATPTSTTVSQPSATPVGEGGSCGGFTQIPRICDTGLTCLTPTQDPNGPIIADLPGKCRKTANIVGEGKWCEAKARPENIKYCKNGLICVFPDIVKEIPGLPGVCQRPSIASRVSTILATRTSVSTSTTRIVVDYSTDLVRSTYTTSRVVRTTTSKVVLATTTYQATESDIVIGSAGTLSCFGIAGFFAFLLF